MRRHVYDGLSARTGVKWYRETFNAAFRQTAKNGLSCLLATVPWKERRKASECCFYCFITVWNNEEERHGIRRQ